MLVYRVEDRRTGVGPYRNFFADITQCSSRSEHTKEHGRPSPIDSGLTQEKFNKVGCWKSKFGFTTVLQAKKWFGEYKGWLDENNFVLAVYKVKPDKLVKLKKQCVFLSDEKIKELNISEALS